MRGRIDVVRDLADREEPRTRQEIFRSARAWIRRCSRIPSYIEYQLGLDIEGREVSFGTKDEEYNGKHSVKVVWIGKKSDPNLSRSAARFFGGCYGDEVR